MFSLCISCSLSAASSRNKRQLDNTMIRFISAQMTLSSPSLHLSSVLACFAFAYFLVSFQPVAVRISFEPPPSIAL